VLHSGDRSAWVDAGIPREVVEGYGVYSQQAAEAMAQAARTRMKADIGLGLTGLAGTDSIDENTPAGAIHIAIAARDGVRYFPSRLPPRRQVVKRRAASTALIELRRFLNAL
jgi:nicotinamide-nucleotide amidase